jgi:hypothetical protein
LRNAIIALRTIGLAVAVARSGTVLSIDPAYGMTGLKTVQCPIRFRDSQPANFSVAF